jgi:hypothetical protein
VSFRDQKAKPGEGFVNVTQSIAEQDPLFARNCAAVAALHHMNPTLQLYRVMAPEFRATWDASVSALDAKKDVDAQKSAQRQRQAEREERSKEAAKRLEELPQILMSDAAQRAIVDVVNSLMRRGSASVEPSRDNDDTDSR